MTAPTYTTSDDGQRVCTECGTVVGDVRAHRNHHIEINKLWGLLAENNECLERMRTRLHYEDLAAEAAANGELALEAPASRETTLAGIRSAKALLRSPVAGEEAALDAYERCFGGGV
jgi:hypothetical protein